MAGTRVAGRKAEGGEDMPEQVAETRRAYALANAILREREMPQDQSAASILGRFSRQPAAERKRRK